MIFFIEVNVYIEEINYKKELNMKIKEFLYMMKFIII